MTYQKFNILIKKNHNFCGKHTKVLRSLKQENILYIEYMYLRLIVWTLQL